MSKERKWWGMPKSLSGFSIWRISNPFDSSERSDDLDDDEELGEENKVLDEETIDTPVKTRRITRSRSRSSSLSFYSRKSSERQSVEVENVDERETKLEPFDVPPISFSFFNDRDDDYIVVDNSITVERKTDAFGNEASVCNLERRKSEILTVLETYDDRDECDGSSLTGDVELDSRLKIVEDTKEEKEEVRHVTMITLTVKPVDYANVLEVTPGYENVVKENDYEVLKDRIEPGYSYPRNSAVPIYACIDKKPKDSTLDSNTSKDLKEALPSVPQPDWDEISEHGTDTNADYAELSTPEVPKEEQEIKEVEEKIDEVKEPEVKNVYEDLEYCQHRAELKPSLRRVTLLRYRRAPSVGKVRTRLGKAWKKVRCWWLEEKIKLGEVILKHNVKKEEQTLPIEVVSEEESPYQEKCEDNLTQIAEDEDIYVGLKSDSEDVLSLGEDVASNSSTTPRRFVRRRNLTSPGLSRSSSIAAFRRSKFCPEGQNGFEELRRYIKQGGDFCKELSAILQERSEAETQYAKTLSKLSGKLVKATKEAVNTVNTAWQRTAIEMEAQSEVHRAFATALSEEVVKPLRQLVESQHRIRKSVETAVDKTGKGLAEWRSAECKAKKQSFLSARENEKMQDAMLDVRIAGGNNAKLSASVLHLHSQKVVSDKENTKMETKRRKAEESVKKADVEYYTYCIRAERARLEWESAVIRGNHCFQALEEERLQQLKELASCYLNNYKEIGPKLVQSVSRLTEPVAQINTISDMESVTVLRESALPLPEQLLPDFYAEHTTLAMNRERRRQALVKILHLIRQDLERERRGKQGVENLARALKQTPNFGAEDSQQNVTEKLHHMRSMLAYLEAARYKVQGALAEMDGRTKESHPLASHIHVTKDRQGLQYSVLKVPTWVRKESIDIGDSPDWTDRGAADGNSVQPDSDFDEFSSQGSERDYQSSVLSQFPVLEETPTSTGQCKALYHYAANLYDELNLSPGDVINIHDKQADGWWLGELNGVVGIFPATYVEEMK